MFGNGMVDGFFVFCSLLISIFPSKTFIFVDDSDDVVEHVAIIEAYVRFMPNIVFDTSGNFSNSLLISINGMEVT